MSCEILNILDIINSNDDSAENRKPSIFRTSCKIMALRNHQTPSGNPRLLPPYLGDHPEQQELIQRQTPGEEAHHGTPVGGDKLLSRSNPRRHLHYATFPQYK